MGIGTSLAAGTVFMLTGLLITYLLGNGIPDDFFVEYGTTCLALGTFMVVAGAICECGPRLVSILKYYYWDWKNRPKL